MPEQDVTPQGNVNEATEQTESPKEVSETNPKDEQKQKSRYQSVEEAEKAKNETDKELDRFTNFTKVLTQDNAREKLDAMYEVDPDTVNRYYKRLYGKTYSDMMEESKYEAEDAELKESNPEVYEMKKQLRELQKQVNESNQKSQKNLLDEFVGANPEISKEELESEMKNLNPNLDMKEKLNKAVSILAGQGKLENTNIKSYMKNSAGLTSVGSDIHEAKKRLTEDEQIAAKFNSKSTYSPGIQKAFKK